MLGAGEIATAVARVSGGNPFFGIGLGPLPDALPIEDAVAAVGAWARTDEPRVAASLTVLGYSARLVGPVLALLTRAGILLDLTAVSCAYAPGAGFRLSLDNPSGTRGAGLEAACGAALVAHLSTIISRVRMVAPAAPALLWGNVASGIAGTMRQLSREAPRSDCRRIRDAVLATVPLDSAGGFDARDAYTRRSCCLYYRLGGGTCGDCPLPADIGSRVHLPG
ncbi:ferric iron reductase protein FhuF [Catenuloplanes nepalensis]|uniref:Ferric iron reductase protein FhuF n=1 Tax=Catenuloplanes nepalensis TaxID=587533 RepID=A0ABT9MVJ0_9ACTN|nr:(2Fe-2S)-binding protein [Catenuloplanes nepalensis]MDP9795390.1 ferric iron reductase protein FhuF [Catenuloplanes nepalensis]